MLVLQNLEGLTEVFGRMSRALRSVLFLAVCIARPTSLAIWHRGRPHRRPNRSRSPNGRHFASLDLKKHPIFRIAGRHRTIFAGFFPGIFLRFQIKRMCFRIASEKKLFRIASDLGMCDSNRIAHRGCIARFWPLRCCCMIPWCTLNILWSTARLDPLLL